MEIKLQNIVPSPLLSSYSQSSLLWGKNVVLNAGECIHVSAPSGTGKSTLLGVLYGTRTDFTGELLINDHPVEDWSPLRAKKIAIVFQDLELLDDLTALENVQLKNQLTAHLSDAEIHALFQEMDVQDLINRKVLLLSRGERQRVAIIRALCMPFEWLLLDEPFSALDEDNTKKAIGLIHRFVKRNNAGMLVSNLFKDTYFKYDQYLTIA